MVHFKRFTAVLTALFSAMSCGVLQAAAADAEDTVSPVQDEEIHWIEYLDEDGEITYVDPEYLKFATRFGDVNADKIVGIADAVQLQRFLLGEIEGLGNWRNADLNGNGQIDVADYTMLKQQLIGKKKSPGGTLAVGVVDMMTGEPLTGVIVNVFAVCGNFAYELGEWESEANKVQYFTGLPTDDSYTYYLDCRNLPAGYGNEYGNWDQQMVLQFGDKTDLGVNARIMKSDEVHNVCLNLYDWASDESACFDDFSPCCNVVVSTKDGIPVYGITPFVEFALPDGEYHAELRMHPGYPLKQMDPDSEFAAYIQSIYPDVTFTDQTGGIDFAVVDGKPDRELRFDLAPLDGRSNSITVSCIDSSTGAPLEGVVISLIEAPDTYAKKVAEWTSDSTGTHTFDGLLHCGYRQHPAYLVRIDSIPAGYLGGYDADVRFGYINGDSNTVNYSFSGDSLPKLVSADVISFEDKSVMNDLTSFEVWKTDPNDSKNTDCIYKSVKPGESFYLPDGDYFAALNLREAHEKGYDGVSFLTRRGQQLKQFFNQQDFLGTAAMVQFKVVDGKPDRELKFYVKLTDPLEDEAELDAETLAKYEALWGSNV